jgi:hypothetical protein
MLWELWRTTRVEAAWRLAFGIIGGLTVLAVFAAVAPYVAAERERLLGFGAVIAMILLTLPHFLGWIFSTRLHGGRPGFPLHLLYTRPVPTALLVGFPMAYLTALPMAIYLVSALLLRVISGYPFPLLSVAAWIAALSVVQLATSWSTRSMLVLMLGNLVAGSAWILFADHRLNSFPNGLEWHDSPNLWPAIFDFPLTDYVLIALIGLASFGVARARVARQRHGAARAAKPRAAGVPGGPKWLGQLFQFPCPTSSATRAQVWFELRSSGLGVLIIGLAIAGLTPLLFALSVPAEWFRPFAIMLTLLSAGAGLFVGTNCGFGTRIKQGRLERSDFDATLAIGSARLAGLKVIVRSACTLAALIALGVSVWGSLSFIEVGTGYEPLRSLQRLAGDAAGALTGGQEFALATVLLIGFIALGASHSALWALWTRYSRRMNIAALLLLLYALALALLALARRNGVAPEFLVDTVFGTTRWIAAAAIVLTVVYLFWSGLAERLLTLRYVGGALLVSAAFAVAWLTVLRAAGVQLAAMPAANAVLWLSPALLPLMGSVLAPWSFNRLRHM